MSDLSKEAELVARQPIVPTSMNMPRELLAQIDYAVKRLPITRTDYLKQALRKAMSAPESAEG
jgi:metal-responsive CopG/Arc/MetJ family transcriptional regulator